MSDLKEAACILLLGGIGSRYSEISEPPKQLIKIYKRTLIENILIHLRKNGIKNFILPLGYKKDYFYNFFKKKKNIGTYNFNLITSKKTKKINKDLNIYLFNAGNKTSKLTRIKKSLSYLKTDFFFVTYGDGLADIDIGKIYKLHKKTNKSIISSTKINSQYGHLKIDKSNNVTKFIEKPTLDMPINIGYYLFKKDSFNENYSKKKELENHFLNDIVKKQKIATYIHKGFFFNIDKKIDLVKLKREKKQIIKNF